MPKMVRMRREQPGVIGVDATVVTIQGDTLRRQKLINERVVEDTERTLDEAELERIQAALVANDYKNLAGAAPRSVQANMGKIVLEVDGTRAEIPAMRGGLPEAAGALPKSSRGVQAIAEVIEALPE